MKTFSNLSHPYHNQTKSLSKYFSLASNIWGKAHRLTSERSTSPCRIPLTFITKHSSLFKKESNNTNSWVQLLRPYFTIFRNKLECLSMAGLSSLVQCLQERQGVYPSEVQFNCSSLGYVSALLNKHKTKLERLVKDQLITKIPKFRPKNVL